MNTPLSVTELSATPLSELADACGVPLERWPGSCYAVAVALVRSGLLPSGSRAVYGLWRGPIAPTGHFGARAGIPFTGHGWVELPSGQVLDPTRWVFEDVPGYLYVGADPVSDDPDTRASLERDRACYDEGGGRLRAATLPPFPAADPTDTTHRRMSTLPPPEVLSLLVGHGYVSGPLTVQQAMWLANLPVDLLGELADPAYGWLEECGLLAFVPIDNLMKVRRSNPTAA